ncbi:MAG TPA: LCP family protein [Actinomycetes bacterium]|nr:LCP family protein [Actinomycetes bacterium]
MSAVLPPELSPRGTTNKVSAPRGRRVFGWLASALAAVVFVASTGGWVLATYYDAKIGRIWTGGALSGNSDGPMNILVVGSDSREGLTLEQARALGTGTAANSSTGQRSDTMMLVHISGDRKNITVVSLPRDSYVTIPAYTDDNGDKHPAQKNKLNAAFALGGAPLLIQTIKDATGMEIDHYVEVGFGGVVKMVDALGGVDVCLPTAANDYRSGLDLPAGTSHVDGVMGLAYVRARYIDPTADIGRMQRQQRFLGSMFQEATSMGVLLDPVQLDKFLRAALSSVKLDEGMTRDMLLDLAADMQELSPKDIRFLTVPLSNVNLSTPVGSAVQWDKAGASKVFEALEADQPLVKKDKGPTVEIAPGEINVQVLNGSTIAGLAGQASDDLATAGYTIAATPANADKTDVTSTIIRYDPQWSTSVKTLEAAFPDATLEEVAGLGGTFEIVVGTDYVKPAKVKVAKPDTKLDSHTAADSICG